VEEERDFVFEVMNFIFNFLTFGWISEILFIIAFLILIFTLIFALKDFAVIRFLIKDRIIFAKQYIYKWILQKMQFLKHFWQILRQEIDKTKLLYIIFTIIVITAILIYLFSQMS